MSAAVAQMQPDDPGSISERVDRYQNIILGIRLATEM